MKYLLSLVAAFVFLLPGAAHAATLSVSPGSGSVATGNIITVRVVTNTQGDAINAAEGTLQFPSDLLDIVSVSKAGSIFSLWVEEPSYSNASGRMTFNGGLPNPGYTGAGTILTVTLHAKKAGTATVSLTDAAVRANDGFGTNVITGSGSSQITITDAAPAPAPTPTPTKPSQPSGPNAIANLVSATHPDQSAWYANPNPVLTWDLPKNASSVQTIVGESAETVPTVTYSPAIHEKQIKELDDGIWYFNIRARTGTYGPISSYRLQIDTTPPTLAPPSFSYDDLTHKLVIAGIHAEDATSGIVSYQLTIDDERPVPIPPSEVVNGTYRLTYRTSGQHTAVFSAVDGAGNRATVASPFIVPVALIDQTLFSIFGLTISLLWFIILILLLTLAALIAAGGAWYRLYTLKQSGRTKIAKREQIVHRSLSMFRTDLERHLRSLSATSSMRKLSEEEAKLKEDLEENLDNLEQYIKKEFKKFDQ